jgi:hypothetical protein
MELVSWFVSCYLEVIIISTTVLTRNYWFTVPLFCIEQRETACSIYRLPAGRDTLHVPRDYGWRWEWSCDGCYVITSNCNALRERAGECDGGVWGARGEANNKRGNLHFKNVIKIKATQMPLSLKHPSGFVAFHRGCYITLNVINSCHLPGKNCQKVISLRYCINLFQVLY